MKMRVSAKVGVKHVHTKAQRYNHDLSVGVVLHIEIPEYMYL